MTSQATSSPAATSSLIVTNDAGVTVLVTDDWVQAEAMCLTPIVGRWPQDRKTIVNTHPTHEWDEQHPRRCTRCRARDNGSYGSHAPCGYDWHGRSLWVVIQHELEQRGTSLAVLRPDLAGLRRA